MGYKSNVRLTTRVHFELEPSSYLVPGLRLVGYDVGATDEGLVGVAVSDSNVGRRVVVTDGDVTGSELGAFG